MHGKVHKVAPGSGPASLLYIDLEAHHTCRQILAISDRKSDSPWTQVNHLRPVVIGVFLPVSWARQRHRWDRRRFFLFGRVCNQIKAFLCLL